MHDTSGKGQGRAGETPPVGGRRGLLRGSVASLAAVTVQQAVARDAAAQAPAAAAAKPAGYDGLAFFNTGEARLVEAVSERIWPETARGAGAKTAGAVHYIDRALAGAYARNQDTYRRGARRLDAHARQTHRKFFVDLTAAEQDEILTRLERDELPGFRQGQGRAFFEMLRTHTMEGVFSDPMYGGNRDFAGWKAVGYPGPFYFITEEQQQQTNAPLSMPYQSVADL